MWAVHRNSLLTDYYIMMVYKIWDNRFHINCLCSLALVDWISHILDGLVRWDLLALLWSRLPFSLGVIKSGYFLFFFHPIFLLYSNLLIEGIVVVVVVRVERFYLANKFYASRLKAKRRFPCWQSSQPHNPQR